MSPRSHICDCLFYVWKEIIGLKNRTYFRRLRGIYAVDCERLYFPECGFDWLSSLVDDYSVDWAGQLPRAAAWSCDNMWKSHRDGII